MKRFFIVKINNLINDVCPQWFCYLGVPVTENVPKTFLIDNKRERDM